MSSHLLNILTQAQAVPSDYTIPLMIRGALKELLSSHGTHSKNPNNYTMT